MKTAGIIGGFDFLGCDITLKFLMENYRVKVLVPLWASKAPRVLHTGLKAGGNLQVFCIDMNNQVQLSEFLKDCDCLIHCGTPWKLDIAAEMHPVYVPVISHTSRLLNALSRLKATKKVVFLTSGSILLSPERNPLLSKPLQQTPSAPAYRNHYMEQAVFHSEKIVSKTLTDFSANRLKIFLVSPVVVMNNLLTHNKEATLAALQFMFRHPIDHDKVFQKLVRRNLLETMEDVTDLPDKVYDCIQENPYPMKFSTLYER